MTVCGIAGRFRCMRLWCHALRTFERIPSLSFCCLLSTGTEYHPTTVVSSVLSLTCIVVLLDPVLVVSLTSLHVTHSLTSTSHNRTAVAVAVAVAVVLASCNASFQSHSSLRRFIADKSLLCFVMTLHTHSSPIAITVSVAMGDQQQQQQQQQKQWKGAPGRPLKNASVSEESYMLSKSLGATTLVDWGSSCSNSRYVPIV